MEPLRLIIGSRLLPAIDIAFVVLGQERSYTALESLCMDNYRRLLQLPKGGSKKI